MKHAKNCRVPGGCSAAGPTDTGGGAVVVYVDILLALNLFVNFYLLLFTAKLGGEKAKILRMLAASFIGSVCSFAIFLPDLGFVLSSLIKLIFSVVIVFVCFGAQNLKRFLRLTATFFAVTFSFAGVMLALWYGLKLKGVAIRNGVVYYDLSPVLLIVSTVAAYLVLTLIRRLTKRNTEASSDTYDIIIAMKNCEVKAKALLDTGNSLSDAFSDAPVVVAEFGVIKDLLPQAAHAAFSVAGSTQVPEGLEYRFRLIPYSVVGGKGLLPAFKPDFVQVCADGYGKTQNALVAVSADPLGGEHRLLIGGELLKACSSS